MFIDLLAFSLFCPDNNNKSEKKATDFKKMKWINEWWAVDLIASSSTYDETSVEIPNLNFCTGCFGDLTDDCDKASCRVPVAKQLHIDV